jgi:hypothetical protein
MKNVTVQFVILLIGISGHAEPTNSGCGDSTIKQVAFTKASYVEKLLVLNSTAQGPERSGCCSHHSGVCGCAGGRATCCDGTVSPSCGCD